VLEIEGEGRRTLTPEDTRRAGRSGPSRFAISPPPTCVLCKYRTTIFWALRRRLARVRGGFHKRGGKGSRAGISSTSTQPVPHPRAKGARILRPRSPLASGSDAPTSDYDKTTGIVERARGHYPARFPRWLFARARKAAATILGSTPMFAPT
jgi:hypothetical protein